MGILDSIKNLTGKNLYYPGCFENEEIISNYKRILKIIGINYIELEDFSCGSKYYELGYKKELRNKVLENLKFLRKSNVKKIITNCSICYYLLKEVYLKINKEFDIEIEHILFPILKYLEKKRPSFNSKIEVSYQDPCYLGRYSNIYEEPRKIISLLGGNILEFKDNKNRAVCCGAAGGVLKNFPNLAKDMAKKRILNMNKNSKILITSCSMCQNSFKKADANSIELSNFILKRLSEESK